MTASILPFLSDIKPSANSYDKPAYQSPEERRRESDKNLTACGKVLGTSSEVRLARHVLAVISFCYRRWQMVHQNSWRGLGLGSPKAKKGDEQGQQRGHSLSNLVFLLCGVEKMNEKSTPRQLCPNSTGHPSKAMKITVPPQDWQSSQNRCRADIAAATADTL